MPFLRMCRCGCTCQYGDSELTRALGCLPPLASVTAVRVVNFTTYNWAKDAIGDVFKRVTGVSPVDEYNKPGSTPTVAGLFTFTTAGLIAGLVTSPLACESLIKTNIRPGSDQDQPQSNLDFKTYRPF